MTKKSLKAVVVTGTMGVLLQFGGCFGGLNGIWFDVLLNAATEFIWDSDAVLDFFGDDGPGLLL